MSSVDIILKAIESVRNLREELNYPVHALVWGQWGSGKTYAARKIAMQSRDVFYCVAPVREVSENIFAGIIALSLGCARSKTLEETIDLLYAHISELDISPIIIVDEAQRLPTRPNLLSLLKDISEHPKANLMSFVFLGDQSAPKFIKGDHSIYKRIIVKQEIKLNKSAVEEVLRGSHVDAETMFKLAKERNWTVWEVKVLASTLEQSGVPASEENIIKVANKLFSMPKEKEGDRR